MKNLVIAALAAVVIALALMVAKLTYSPAAPKGKMSAAGASRAHSRQLWWDPMLGASSVSDHPGKSAMGMEMVPYAGPAAAGGKIMIDPAIVQDMGVRTAAVTRGPLRVTIRAVGLFKLPQPGLHDVSLKIGGWIDKLFADQVGMHISKGEPVFALYSPDLQVAGQELISAVQAERALDSQADPALRKEAEELIASARRKLELWDVDSQEIDAISKAASPPRDVVFRSPASGHLEEKAIVAGSAVQPGMMLLRIADHRKVWLDAEVFEEQIPLVKLGQTVTATVDAAPGRTFTGVVDFIFPHLDPATRTLTVRSTFDSQDFVLKPGMFADAGIIVEPIAGAISVPREAVIDTGTRQIVFVARGGGHFLPQIVRVGIRADDDRIQIVSGLSVGESVVTSGEFLMDVESRTNEAIAKLRGASAAAASQPSAVSPPPAMR